MPSYPIRGIAPWDTLLKEYIDASLNGISNAQMADYLTQNGASRTAILSIINSGVISGVAAERLLRVQAIQDAIATEIARANGAYATPSTVGAYVTANTPAITAAAVALAQTDAGLVHGDYVTSIDPGAPAFVITDTNGGRSWLEIASDGGPTQHAKDVLEGSIPGLAQSAIGLGRTYVITDQQNHVLAYGDTAGHFGFTPDDVTMEYIRSKVSAGQAHISGPDLYAPGDSLTAGAGGGGTTWPGVVQSLLTASGYNGMVRNGGVGGETSVTIAARTNATPLTLLVTGGQIPAGVTPVTVTLQPINGQAAAPLIQGDGGGTTGVLWTESGPVPGSISLSGTDYKFTRTTTGSAVTCARPSAFRYDFGKARRGDIALIAIGQNGPSDQRAIEDAKAIIQEMDAAEKRWLVLSRPSTTDAQDALYDAAFGRRHVAVRKYLVTYGLADAGITPTTQDNTDIANGTVPSSLRVDSVHGNAAYYTIVGTIVYRRLREMGWV